MEYNLELEKAAEEIISKKSKIVCIQLPDGLKPQADKIKQELEEKTDAKIIIWLGSCFGACDVPLQVKSLGVNLIIQFGHNKFE